MSKSVSRWQNLRNALGFGSGKNATRLARTKQRRFSIEPLEERALLSLCTWDGGGNDNNWTTAANWAGDVAPVAGDDLCFTGTVRTGTQNDFTAGTSFKSIEFASNGFSLAGNDAALTDGVTVDSGVTGSTVSVGLALGGSSVVNVVDTTLAISGIVSGSNTLTKAGSGTLTLSGANTYTGGTSIQNGVLAIAGGNDRLPTGTTVTLGNDSSSGVLQLGDGTAARNQTLASLLTSGTGANNRVVGGGTSNATLTLNISTSNTFAGVLGGTGTNQNKLALVKAGTGTLTLSGTNTYTSTTTINAGMLQAKSFTAIPYYYTAGRVIVNSGGTLAVNAGGTGEWRDVHIQSLLSAATPYFYSGSVLGIDIGGVNYVNCSFGIGGSLTLAKMGSGTLGLTYSNNTYTGGTRIQAGTVLFRNGGLSNSGDITISGNATIQWWSGNTQDISGVSGGLKIDSGITATLNTNGNNITLGTGFGAGSTGSITKVGEGILTLAAANTYTGTTTVNAGSLAVTAANACIGNVTVNSGRPVSFVSGGLGSSGTITINGNSTLQWAGNNTDDISNRLALVNTTTVTLDLGSNDVAFASGFGGNRSAKIVKNGTGTLTLSGQNTYTGGTTINDGAVSFVSGGLGPNGTITFYGNSTLEWAEGNTDDISGRMSIGAGASATFDTGSNTVPFGSTSYHAGSLVKNGCGTLVFTGTFDSTSGNVTISAGTIQVGAGGTTGNINATGIVNNGELVFDRSDLINLNEAISGAGHVTKRGTGILLLANSNNTYAGGTTIYSGTVSFVNGGLGDSGDITFTGDSTLQWYRWLSSGNNEDISSRLVIDDGVNVTFDTYGNNVTLATAFGDGGAGSITKVGEGTLTLAAANTYTGSTTVNAGTLLFEESVTLGPDGPLTANAEAHVCFKDGLALTSGGTLTVNNSARAYFIGSQSVTGTGQIVLNSSAAKIYSQGINSSTPATLTVGANVTVRGAGTITKSYTNDSLLNQGTIQADTGTLTIDIPSTNYTNEGTFGALGSGILVRDGVELRGSRSAISGTELFLQWAGLDIDAQTYTLQASDDDGANYSTMATFTADDLTFLQGDLLRSTPYHLRIVATAANGGKEIYEGGSISTLDLPDTSGWYKIRIENVHTYDPSFSTMLPGFPANYSGVFAGSSQGAIMRSLPGLVANGSVPTADPVSGQFQLYTYDDIWGPRPSYTAGVSIPVLFNLFTDLLRGASDAACSDDPIRYFDGAVDYSATDVQSAGLGSSFAQTRSWTVYTALSANQRNGAGWIDSAMPTVQQDNAGLTMTIVRSAMDVQTFELSGGQYVPTTYAADTLVHDTINHEFVWADSQGNQTHFYDFSSNTPAGRAGQMKLKSDAGGLLTHVTAWTDDGGIQEIRRQDANEIDVESWLYSYLAPSDPNAGLLSSVQLRQSDGQGGWAVVRQVAYDYYTVTDLSDCGNKHDLKTAIVKDADGNVLSTDYYRYHTPSAAATLMMSYPIGGLKYVFDSASYARLCAAVGDPFTATDAQVAPYAQHHFEYDQSRRCTEHEIQGTGGPATDGIGSFAYEYFVNSVFSTDSNAWQHKTVETLPDGNQNIIYCNAVGQIILKDFHDISDAANPALSGHHWLNYYQYNSEGQVLLEAEPSAVANYAVDGNSVLTVTLASTSGLIHLADYYSTTTATASTAGGVKGYVQNVKIKQGSSGTPVLQETRDYYNKTYGGSTNVVLANDTAYRNTDGTGGETTNYSYNWYPNTVGVQSITVTSPIVTEMDTAYYDAYGRPVWIKDAEGYLTYVAYDNLTGGVIKTIADVDTQSTGDFTGLPTGWTTPTGGGLHLITTMQVDALGRTTKITDPEGNVTYAVYDDVNHEGRIYAGWDATTHTTAGPVVVYRVDLAGNYTETLTFTWDDANGLPVDAQGRPTGAEALTDARADIQSLNRSLKNAANQVAATRQYTSLGGLTYSTTRNLGTSGVNYLETTMAYEPWGALVVAIDPSGTIDEAFNDALGRLSQEWAGTDDVPSTDYNGDSVIDALDFRYWVSQNASATTGPAGTSMKIRVRYGYDVDGKLTSLSDADQNTTTWEYDAYGRLVEETNELDASRSFSYDMLGNLLSKTDRDGRVTTYTYDDRNRVTAENWLDAQENVIRTFTYSYDGNSLLLSASDPDAEYEYTYDGVGCVVSETQEIDGLTPTLVLASQYDDASNRTQVAATVGGTADFVNDYTYDALNRTTSLSQQGATGGNAVAEKLIDLVYNAAGRWDTITRYANLAGTQLVAESDYAYDLAGRLTDLTYHKGATTLVDYDWTYDAASRLTQYVNSIDGTVDYTNDATGQLTEADYDYQTDESYSYDANGNRTITGYVTGDNNQLLSDGTYRYSYDAEGNRTAKFVDADADGVLDAGDTDITTYAWDYRNRLTTVSHFDGYTDYSGEEPDQVVGYSYDFANRLVGKVLDSDGNGTVDSSSVFVYDGGQIALQFDHTGTGDAAAADLSHRYLWGPAVDQLLADEHVESLQTAGDVVWPLTDNLGTVRDLATYNSGTDTTTIANHRVFDAYGNLKSETNAAVDCLFGFTGRQFDEDTGLQNNLNRWYDAKVGRWVSEDPIGFNAGDTNLYRYVRNSPTTATDPAGLWTVSIGINVNWTWGIVGFTGTVGIAVDSSGRIGTFMTGGAGAGVGAKASGGVSIAASNARTICDLEGPFGQGSFGAGAGAAGSVDMFGGDSPNGKVTGGGVTIGAGLGGSGSVSGTGTTVKNLGKLW